MEGRRVIPSLCRSHRRLPAIRGKVISSLALAPAAPTTNDIAWVTARVTDDLAVTNVTLTYSTGAAGGISQTNTVFLETMASVSSKPWTGGNCVNAWTVTGSSFEQRGGANYGTGNTNGMEFKGGTTNLTDSMIATTGSVDARGNSGFVEFWIQTLTISNQYSNAGWTFQLDSGGGYVTRLSELTGTSHGWMLYHYDLQASELVRNLKMRFLHALAAGEDEPVRDGADVFAAGREHIQHRRAPWSPRDSRQTSRRPARRRAPS